MIELNFTITYKELYFIIINIASFLYYGFDKLQALKNKQNISRVPEIYLLFVVFIGGTIGAIISMILFRHKIKKISFLIKLSAIVLIQIFAGVYYLFAI